MSEISERCSNPAAWKQLQAFSLVEMLGTLAVILLLFVFRKEMQVLKFIAL